MRHATNKARSSHRSASGAHPLQMMLLLASACAAFLVPSISVGGASAAHGHGLLHGLLTHPLAPSADSREIVIIHDPAMPLHEHAAMRSTATVACVSVDRSPGRDDCPIQATWRPSRESTPEGSVVSDDASSDGGPGFVAIVAGSYTGSSPPIAMRLRGDEAARGPLPRQDAPEPPPPRMVE